MGFSLAFFKMWQNTLNREVSSRRVKPIDSIAFVTYRCTSRCNTCNMWQRTRGREQEIKERELTTHQWTSILEKLHRSGITSLEIFGGDALLRRDVVYPLIERCTQFGIDTFFPTNCNLLDEKTASTIVSSGLGTVYFSVDGIDELQNSIRGVADTYIRTEQAIWNVYNAKVQFGEGTPKMGILPTVSSMNVEKIEAILSELENFPIDFVYLRAMGEMTGEDAERSSIDGIKATPYFVSTVEESHLLSEEQVYLLSYVIKRLRKDRTSKPFYLGLSHIESLSKETFTEGLFPAFPCHVCTTVVTLTPYGEIVPCPFFTDFSLGNIDEEHSLDSIWGNEKHRRFLKKQRNGELTVCRKCSMRHFYPGIKEAFRQVFFPYFYAPFLNDK